MKKIKELIKNPWAQLICIVIVLICYWSWDIIFTHDAGEYTVQQEVVQDTTKVLKPDSTHVYQYKKYTSPSPELEKQEEEIPVEEQSPSSDLEWKYKWWDMILGHVSSILGSLVALAIPAYNFWSKRNKK